MLCPICQKWSEVKETRRRQDGSKYRRYICGNLHRFSTTEVVILGYKKKEKKHDERKTDNHPDQQKH